MRAPEFWQRPGSLQASLLSPLGFIYGLVAAQRMRPGAAPPVPALYVGNFTAGGAGKTPVAMLIATMAYSLGARPAILSRGYGGSLSSGRPIIVEPLKHTAEQVGDEALLLARCGQTIIGRDRSASARLAVSKNANFLILDDGFQSAALKAPALIVVDGATGIGNGRVIPAGPLRAPLQHQMQMASALLILGEGSGADQFSQLAARNGKPVFTGRLIPDPEATTALRGQKVFAFAGIGRPEKFFETLEKLGAKVVGRRAFADHRAYSEADARSLDEARRASGASLLVTTEKDLARLPQEGAAQAILGQSIALPVAAKLDQTSDFLLWLSKLLIPQKTEDLERA